MAIAKATLAMVLLVAHANLTQVQGKSVVPSRQQVERHLDTLFAGTDGTIRKWAGPVRFSVVGSPSRQHWAGVRQLTSAIASATGIRIVEVSESERPANFVIFFGSDASEFASEPWASIRLRKFGESEPAYVARIDRGLKSNGFVIGRLNAGSFENRVVVIVNASADKFEPVSVTMRAGFAGFMAFAPSNAIVPSLTNAKSQGLQKMSAVDLAILSALYSPQIHAGQAYAEARDQIVRMVMRRLESK